MTVTTSKDDTRMILPMVLQYLTPGYPISLCKIILHCRYLIVKIYKDQLFLHFYILFSHSFVSFFGLGAVSAAVMSSAGQLVKL